MWWESRPGQKINGSTLFNIIAKNSCKKFLQQIIEKIDLKYFWTKSASILSATNAKKSELKKFIEVIFFLLPENDTNAIFGAGAETR